MSALVTSIHSVDLRSPPDRTCGPTTLDANAQHEMTVKNVLMQGYILPTRSQPIRSIYYPCGGAGRLLGLQDLG